MTTEEMRNRGQEIFEIHHNRKLVDPGAEIATALWFAGAGIIEALKDLTTAVYSAGRNSK